MTGGVRWERLLECGLVAATLLFIVTAFSPTWKPDQSWRVRLQQAVLTERLVTMGFERPEAHAAVVSLTPTKLASMSASVGTERPTGWVLGAAALFMMLSMFVTLRLVWS